MPLDPAHYRLDEAAYRNGDHTWLDELTAVAGAVGPPFHRMGTRAIDEADWLPADGHRDRELALRRRLVEDGFDEVFASTADTGDAAAEAASMVAEWLARHRPGAELRAAPDDRSVEDGSGGHGAMAVPPLVRAGLQVQEDLCVMERDQQGWRLTAGLVCFPTYWRLDEKIGRSQGVIHGPVPHFADELADRVGLFFDRLAPGRIVARRNWGFSAHPLLFVPHAVPDGVELSYAPERLWLRSERQTLRRLPRTGAVLFTIKVQLAPATALGERPELAARLLAVMQNWSPELVRSRGGRHGWYGEVTGWLRTLGTDLPTDRRA